MSTHTPAKLGAILNALRIERAFVVDPRTLKSPKVDPKAVAAMRALGRERPGIVIRGASAKKAREMLGLEWSDVAEISGVYPFVVLKFEHGGPANELQREALQKAFEGEGLVFSSDGGVAWRARGRRCWA